ncbi:putative GTPase Rab7 [Paratrimastix pyriformis]|uniref:GTPase Rab7 n=1 Tax=Paratrimastix pyriformis TaxID=342808 RepID=A0ABQ8UBC3_9EUKA|nr:putative GTPase Rab7 [Paratrimastix pyriformis]
MPQQLKVVVLGGEQAGKTALIHRWIDDTFVPRYKLTSAPESIEKEVAIEGKAHPLQIWDTVGGQQRVENLEFSFYRDADCCVLVFDVSSQRSFDRLQEFRDQFLRVANPVEPASFPFIVIGNKIDDRDTRIISPKRAEQYCQKNHMRYFECSARDNTNTSEVLQDIARAALLRHQSGSEGQGCRCTIM